MGRFFPLLILFCGVFLEFLYSKKIDDTCYGCELFNVREKDQKSRRAILTKCPRQCFCPNNHVTCQDGIPRIIDGCGCCYMCARQYGDSCSIVDRCDDDKGLFCDMVPNTQHGICKARTPKTCTVNGKVYNDGDTFNLDCKSKCTCQNGHYGCTDRCVQEHQKPSALFCVNPVLMSVRGQCCKEWTCPTPNKTESNKMPRHIASNYEIRPQNNPRYEETNTGNKQINEVVQPGNLDCSINNSKWSQCSVSCGVGISVRMAPKHCRRKEDTRLCYLRPCDRTLLSSDRRNKCSPTTRLLKREKITYKDCKSVRAYRLKFCTNCRVDQCCYPKRTKTREIEFLCNDGRYEYLKYAWIKRCKCSKHCKE